MADQRTTYPAKEHYRGSVARDYLDRRSRSRKWLLEEQAVNRLLGRLPPGAQVLDAPIGTSRFDDPIRENQLKRVGVDLSLAMLGQAPTTMRGLAACADIGELPFADASVDYVLSIRFLNWLTRTQLAGALAELKRVASSGLVVGIRTQDRVRPPHIVWSLGHLARRPIDSLGRLSAPLRNRFARGEPSILIHPTELVTELFTQLGLEVVASEPVADGTEFTRRAFRFTPLRILLLRRSGEGDRSK